MARFFKKKHTEATRVHVGRRFKSDLSAAAIVDTFVAAVAECHQINGPLRHGTWTLPDDVLGQVADIWDDPPVRHPSSVVYLDIDRGGYLYLALWDGSASGRLSRGGPPHEFWIQHPFLTVDDVWPFVGEFKQRDRSLSSIGSVRDYHWSVQPDT